MGAPSPICQRVAHALAQGEVALLPSDGLYMALVSAAHCESRDKLDELCGADPSLDSGPELVAFTRSADDLKAWGLALPKAASAAATAFWPGPLSFVYKVGSKTPLPEAFRDDALEVCCAKQSFLREVMRALAQESEEGNPPLLIGRHAHRNGKLPVTSGRWLPQSLGEKKIGDLLERVPFVIDAGPTQNGCLPTALQVSNSSLTLVRQGPISAETLADKLGQPVQQELRLSPASHGELQVHLAPEPAKGLMTVEELAADTWAVGVGPRPKNCPDERWIELYEKPEAFIAEFFDALARASDAGAKTVYVRVPNDELRSRLGLAAAKA